MFDPPTVEHRNNNVPFASVESEQHIKLARLAAQKAISLYKNANNVLPLSLISGTGTLFVAGYTADDGDNLQGNYAQRTDHGGYNASILAGLVGVLGQERVRYLPGCSFINCTQDDFTEISQAASHATASVVVLGTIHNNKNNDDIWTDCGSADGNGTVIDVWLWMILRARR
jgi:beta-glucosidase-like glycosyl hydrolase